MDHFKPCLMGHTSKDMEDSGGECDMLNGVGLPQKVSGKKNLVCCLEILLGIF